MTTAEGNQLGVVCERFGMHMFSAQMEVYRYVSVVDSDIFVRVTAKKRIAVIPGDGIGKEVK